MITVTVGYDVDLSGFSLRHADHMRQRPALNSLEEHARRMNRDREYLANA